MSKTDVTDEQLQAILLEWSIGSVCWAVFEDRAVLAKPFAAIEIAKTALRWANAGDFEAADTVLEDVDDPIVKRYAIAYLKEAAVRVKALGFKEPEQPPATPEDARSATS